MTWRTEMDHSFFYEHFENKKSYALPRHNFRYISLTATKLCCIMDCQFIIYEIDILFRYASYDMFEASLLLAYIVHQRSIVI